MAAIHIIHAPAQGHAEAVADEVVDALIRGCKTASAIISKSAARESRPRDLLETDVIVFISSEEQGKEDLHADMRDFLYRSSDVDLEGRWVACVSLSNDAKTAEELTARFREFIDAHHGKLFLPPLPLTEEEAGEYAPLIDPWVRILLAQILHGLQPISSRWPLAR